MFPQQKETGWIKIDRKIVSWEYFDDPIVRDLFTNFFIRLAAHKPFEYKGETYPRGSFISTVKELSELSGYTVDQVRLVIKKLETSKSITNKSTNKFTVFKVLKYAKYQDVTDDKSQTKNQTNPKQIPNKTGDT